MRRQPVAIRDIRSGSSAARICRTARHGFTLVEVVIAMALTLIVVVGLVGAYAANYGRVMQSRIATIGQNLAQLQLEDALSIDRQVLSLLVQGQDIGDINYINVSAAPPLVDVNADATVYDSGKVDGTFYITGVAAVNVPSMGVVNHQPSSASDIPELALPAGLVDLSPVYHATAETPYWDYTVTLHKHIFPGYQRRVVISDTTPASNETAKVYRVDVTIYWTIAGNEQHYTVSAEE